MTKRTFEGKKKGDPFTITTTLTDAQAIEALGGYDGRDFKANCAFEIHKMSNGLRYRDNLVAWGFRMAEEISNPRNAVTIPKKLRDMVRFRKPAAFTSNEGENIVINLCGAASRNAGKYRIHNGLGFRDGQVFYGFADPKGAWTPTRATPQSVIDAIQNFGKKKQS